MTRRVFVNLCALAAFLTVMTGSPVNAQNRALDFKLVNKTGVTISSIYIAPHDTDEWGDDVMKEDVLRNGESIDLEFHPKAKAEEWDLRIEDKEGNSVEWESLDLTEINVLTIKIVNGKPVAEWK
ncbi:MAG: argininosuccinate lyase [Acidimicrobiia bacterium]